MVTKYPPCLPSSIYLLQVKFVERHGEISDATAAFVRFAIAAGASLPFADFKEKEALLAGGRKRKVRRETIAAPCAQHTHACSFVHQNSVETKFRERSIPIAITS